MLYSSPSPPADRWGTEPPNCKASPSVLVVPRAPFNPVSIPIPRHGEGKDVLCPDLADDATRLPSAPAALLVHARSAPRFVDGRAASITDKQEERDEAAGPGG